MAEISKLFVTIGSTFDSKGFKQAAAEIRQVGIAATAMGGLVVAAGLKVAKAAGDQEQAELTLAQAMKQAGTFTQEALQHSIDYASALQQLTTYGDEAILGVQRMLTNFGVEGEMLDQLTKATLDLAAAKGMDLKAAADLVAKSVGSSTNALTRYGIEVTGAAGSTERAQMAVENITKIFGGAAQAQANTYLGRIQQLSNVWGDFQEEIGKEVIPILEKLILSTKTFLLSASEWVKNNQALVSTIVSFAGGLGTLMVAFGPVLVVLPTVIALVVNLTSKVQLLWAAVSAHPLIAITSALAAATLALHKFLDAKKEEEIKNIELGKSTESLINIQKQEIESIREAIRVGKLKGKDAEAATARLVLLKNSVAELDKKLLKESVQDTKAAEDKKEIIIDKSTKNTNNNTDKEVDKRKEATKQMLAAQKEWVDGKKYLDLEYKEFKDLLDKEAKEKDDEAKELDFQNYMKILQNKIEKFQEFTDQVISVVDNYYAYQTQKIQNQLNEDLDSEDQRYEARKAWINANITDEARRNEMLDELEEGHSATVNNLKDAAERKEKELKSKMKSWAIGEAIINTALSATKSLALFGFPYGAVMAALAIAAGTLQVATIKAQKFAKGALIKTPTLATFAEEGPEIALPLNNPQTTAALSKALALAGSAGNIYVTVPPITTRGEARKMGDIIGREIFNRVRRSRKV